MAVEAKRGCGFRQVGGLYMIGGELSAPCDRLPYPLDICPCCGAGIKYTRGFTWIQPLALFKGNHSSGLEENSCQCFSSCPVCYPAFHFAGFTGAENKGRAGLLWIGEQFYKTPKDFIKEGMAQGISRRVQAIPRGFVIGKTWVFLAHIKAAEKIASGDDGELFDEKPVKMPGIFAAFRPTRFERIVKQSEFDLYKTMDISGDYFDDESQEIYKRLKSDTDRGVTLVPVPDDDPDHNKALKK